MFDTHKNFAIGTVLTAPGDASGETFTLMPGDGQVFAPNMPVTICPPNVQPTGDNSEIGYLTSAVGDVLTITRAQEGSLPMQVASGWQVIGSVTAKSLTDIEGALGAKVDTGSLAPVATSGSYNDLVNLPAPIDLSGKADLVGGVVPTSQIPALALTSTQVVANQGAMLALTPAQVQPGDIAVRLDGAGTFILNDTDPSILANWTRLNAPTDVVLSVNGQIGTVVLGKADVGLPNADNTSDLSKPISTATQNALNAKSSTTYVDAQDAALQGQIAANATAINTKASLSGLGFGRSPGDGIGLVGVPLQSFFNLQTCMVTKTITKMQTYCGAFSGVNQIIELGIYSEAGTLLSSGTATVSATGMVSVTLSSPVAVTAGANYWLAICGQVNNNAVTFTRFNSISAAPSINRFSGDSVLPSILPAGSGTATAFCLVAL